MTPGKLATRAVCALVVVLSLPSAAWAASDASTYHPTCHNPCDVEYQPEIYIDFWGPGWSNDPLNERGYLTSFVNSIDGSKWLETLGQYHVGWQKTSYKGSWSDPALSHRPGPNPSQSAVQAEATRAARHFGVSKNRNIMIIVALPHGGTCAPYHSWDSDVNVAYIAYPYNGDPFPNGHGTCAGGAQTVSHEIAEAMTDPHPYTGWSPEVADGPCEGQAREVTMRNGKSFYVQALWSNAAKRCVFTS